MTNTITCNDAVPLVEEGEQRFKLEDRDIVQMNNMMIVVFGLPSKYTSEYGGVGKQEMSVYLKWVFPTFQTDGVKSPRSVIHMQVTYLKSSYVI